jgi:hypothetical protein
VSLHLSHSAGGDNDVVLGVGLSLSLLFGVGIPAKIRKQGVSSRPAGKIVCSCSLPNLDVVLGDDSITSE